MDEFLWDAPLKDVVVYRSLLITSWPICHQVKLARRVNPRRWLSQYGQRDLDDDYPNLLGFFDTLKTLCDCSGESINVLAAHGDESSRRTVVWVDVALVLGEKLAITQFVATLALTRGEPSDALLGVYPREDFDFCHV